MVLQERIEVEEKTFGALAALQNQWFRDAGDGVCPSRVSQFNTRPAFLRKSFARRVHRLLLPVRLGLAASVRRLLLGETGGTGMAPAHRELVVRILPTDDIRLKSSSPARKQTLRGDSTRSASRPSTSFGRNCSFLESRHSLDKRQRSQ